MFSMDEKLNVERIAFWYKHRIYSAATTSREGVEVVRESMAAFVHSNSQKGSGNYG